MPAKLGYQPVPEQLADDTQHRILIARALNGAMQGKTNVTTTVTLAVSATTTTLNDPRIGPSSFIGFMPTTAHALAALGTLYVSAVGKQTATITHASSANADQTFQVVIIG